MNSRRARFSGARGVTPANVVTLLTKAADPVGSAALKIALRRKWRRGELNPRPETTQMAASTCLSGLLISIPAAEVGVLRRDPDVCFSPLRQRPSVTASVLISAYRSHASR